MEKIKFKTKNHSRAFWSSYARQTIDFQNALAELIDNSLSARKKNAAGRKIPATIEITIEELENYKIRVQVVDDGKGVTLDQLTSEDNIFNLGYESPSKGEMNEHGFGLKNALALLTSGFTNDFTFYSKPERTSALYKVIGPIQEEMSVTKVSDSEWSENLEVLSNIDSGVKVIVDVKPEYFNSLYARGKTFETLIERLGEHLGVMYNRFLQEDNYIILRYKSRVAPDWTKREVPAISTPFKVNEVINKSENSITIEFAGKEYKVKYIHGELDPFVRSDKSKEAMGWPYPLKIHYQGSNARGGVTLNVRGRVLKTGIFKEIWPNKAGDVTFNNFLAELQVQDDFNTTNNKTDIDPHSEVWKLLKEELNEKFSPERTTRKQSEESLRKNIAKSLENAFKLHGDLKPSKKAVWDRGAEIDIYFENNDKKYLYELKVLPGKVEDVYQLKMYWDGIVEESGQSPEEATLVAERFENYVIRAINYVNSLKDGNGKNYKIDTKLLSEYITG